MGRGREREGKEERTVRKIKKEVMFYLFITTPQKKELCVSSL